MKLIDISSPKHPNTFTMVDDEDFESLNQWKWWLFKGAYACRKAWNPKTKGSKNIRMHRQIMGLEIGAIVDHIDGNGLNNQKSNLRPATGFQNSRNRKKIESKTSSKFKGVFFNKIAKRWAVQIGIDKKKVFGGYFTNETHAAAAYNALAVKYHGEFARLNQFPEAQP